MAEFRASTNVLGPSLDLKFIREALTKSKQTAGVDVSAQHLDGVGAFCDEMETVRID